MRGRRAISMVSTNNTLDFEKDTFRDEKSNNVTTS